MNRALAEGIGTFSLLFFGCGAVAADARLAGPLAASGAHRVLFLAPPEQLGVTLPAGELDALWIYLVVPALGAIVAAPTCRIVQGEACCDTCPPTEESHD